MRLDKTILPKKSPIIFSWKNTSTIWKKYVETALIQNINPLWTNRVGYVDWVKITEWVEQDIEIAKMDI